MAKGPKRKKTKKKALTRPEIKSGPSELNPKVRDLLLIFCVVLAAYLALSLFTDWGGWIGAGFKGFALEWFGQAAYFSILIPLFFMVFLSDMDSAPNFLHVSYLLIWFASITVFFDLLNAGGKSEILAGPIISLFGKGGSAIFSWAFLIAATLFVLNVSLGHLWSKLSAFAAFVLNLFKPRPVVSPMTSPEIDLGPPVIVEPLASDAAVDTPPLAEARTPESVFVAAKEPLQPEVPSEPPASSGEPVVALSAEPPLAQPQSAEPECAEQMEMEIHPVFSPPKKRARREKLVNGYRLPPLDLFTDPVSGGDKETRGEPSDYSKLLEDTLKSFGVEATVINVERGPAVTRYELAPAKGVKVSKVVSLRNDLALALAATSLRLEAPIPGKNAIGIEIPNSSASLVYYKEMLKAKVYQESDLKLMIALGKDITGHPVFADLKRMPHLLIAGATGSGKTVCINTLIASILCRATPLEVQFVMIDPKMVELTIYDGIPHLIQEVVTDAKTAARALVDVAAIMRDRYDLFKEARVRNMDEYNRARPETPLPHIVVVIDELADLMMTSANAVETTISRLAALARAAGIHLVVATQRPSVNVITGVIKANIPSRIAFAVSNQFDSRTILDDIGAETLLGRGDMLFSPIDANKALRLQGAYVSLEEIEALVKFWTDQPPPDNLVVFPEPSEEPMQEEPSENGDALYSEAKEIILRTGQASVSTLQRKLKIGYARAGRLMDILEQRGVVGPADGAKPRKILVPNPFRPGN